MAILQQPVVSGNVFGDEIGDDLAPAGTFMATVIDIRDEFGVQRTKFQSTETEMVDLTTFLFGFRDAQGFEHRVASRRMKISGNEKSSLFAFLKSLLGRAPTFGWDYCELRGAQCLLTVEHIQRRDGTGVFAAIAALSPVPQGMGGNCGMGNGAQAGNGSAQPRPPAARSVVASGGGAMAGRPVGPAPVGGTAVRSFGGVQGGQAVRPFDNAQGRPNAPSPAPVNDPIPF